MPTDAETSPQTLHEKRRGITPFELFIILIIILLVLAILLTGLTSSRSPGRMSPAKTQIKIVAMATTIYTSDWNDFPPFDLAVNTSPRRGAELLYNYLCVPHSIGDRKVGGYLSTNDSNVHRGTGIEPALISPLHGFYTFGFEGKGRDLQWVIIDPGKDKLLGGIMSAENGFVPDNSDANGDGNADHLDNLIEKVSLH